MTVRIGERAKVKAGKGAGIVVAQAAVQYVTAEDYVPFRYEVCASGKMPQRWSYDVLVSPTPALPRHKEPYAQCGCPTAGVPLSRQAR